MGELEGRVAVVTGGASGIGAACVRALANAGAAVVIGDSAPRRAMDVVASVAVDGGRAALIAIDVSRAEDCEALVNEAVRRYGGCDIAVNAAGIAGSDSALAELAVEDWAQVLAVNLTGVFLSVRAQLRHMTKAGGGVIINVASVLGCVAPSAEACAGYTAAKHGVIGLTRAAAVEYAQQGIRVNSVGPGYIATPMVEAMGDPFREAVGALHPMGRLGTADEVAGLVCFLAGERAAFITGAHYAVDGGYTAW